MTAGGPSARAAVALIAGGLVVAAAVRILPISSDFWLDEIWTYFTARGLSSPAEVFTAIHHSNNNHLNTLILYWLGDREAWAVYRIPSLAAGIGSVALAAVIAWRRGRLEAVFAAALTGSCFALLHFSSEARGYSLAVFFALSAYWALERELETDSRWNAPIFGLSVVLGFLSHLVYLFFYAGAVLWSALHRPGRDATLGGALGRLARLHLFPIACLIGLYLVDLRHMRVGGGPPTPVDQVLARSFGYALGLPVESELALPYAALGAAILGLGLRLLHREGSDAWLLFLVTIALAPLAAIAAMRPGVVAVRYFLIGIAFFLLLASYLLAALYRSGWGGRIASLAALSLFVLGNAGHAAAFLDRGRGGYREALLFMARRTEGPRIEVGSDHDFRNEMVLRFYARHLPQGKTLAYVPRGEWPRAGPEWLITHSGVRSNDPPAQLDDRAGNRYTLAAEFDHGAISGFYWAVYHNVGR